VTSLRSRIGSLLLAPALAACSFSFSAGGPDYTKLEKAITDKLNESYAPISRQVSKVDCPTEATPKIGDTFICNADIDGNEVRVQAKVTDDKGNVDFSTLDVVFDLERTATGLSHEISQDRGFAVTVTCGDGLKVVEIGQSFECEAADPQGVTRTVKVTAGAPGETDHWEILDA
jgi:hypothetical protein